MPARLVIEDGTCPAGSNCYCGLEYAGKVIRDRGRTDWPSAPESGDDPEGAAKAAALVRATDYLNGLHWYGRRISGNRLMAWPRVESVDKDGYEVAEGSVPEAVRLACAYLAYLSYTEVDIQPILERGNRTSAKQVDTISNSYWEDGPARDVYAFVADALYPLCSDFDMFAGGATGFGDRGLTVNTVIT